MAYQPQAPQSLDYLNPGAEVIVTTSLKADVTGEVIACDGNARVLLLKSHRADQPPDVDDIHLINMDHVTKVVVIKDVPETANGGRGSEPEISYVDLQEVQNRFNQKMAIRNKDRPATGGNVASNKAV